MNNNYLILVCSIIIFLILIGYVWSTLDREATHTAVDNGGSEQLKVGESTNGNGVEGNEKKEKIMISGTVSGMQLNQPVENAEIVFRSGGKKETEVISDKNGTFSAALRGDGKYEVLVNHSNYLPLEDTLHLPDEKKVIRQINLTPSARVTGRVLSDEGIPVENMPVVAEFKPPSLLIQLFQMYVMENESPSPFDNKEITLKGMSIPAGYLLTITTDQHENYKVQKDVTDSEGSFSMGPLIPSYEQIIESGQVTYEITADGERKDFSREKVEITPEPGKNQIEFELERQKNIRFSGRIIHPEEGQVSGEVALGIDRLDRTEKISVDKGTFDVTLSIPKQKYEEVLMKRDQINIDLEFSRQGEVYTIPEQEVPSPPDRVDLGKITLPDRHFISGYAYDNQRETIEDAQVIVHHYNEDQSYSTHTDSNGFFGIYGPAPAKVELNISKVTGKLGKPRHTIRYRDSAHTGDLNFPLEAELSQGRVDYGGIEKMPGVINVSLQVDPIENYENVNAGFIDRKDYFSQTVWHNDENRFTVRDISGKRFDVIVQKGRKWGITGPVSVEQGKEYHITLDNTGERVRGEVRDRETGELLEGVLVRLFFDKSHMYNLRTHFNKWENPTHPNNVGFMRDRTNEYSMFELDGIPQLTPIYLSFDLDGYRNEIYEISNFSDEEYIRVHLEKMR